MTETELMRMINKHCEMARNLGQTEGALRVLLCDAIRLTEAVDAATLEGGAVESMALRNENDRMKLSAETFLFNKDGSLDFGGS